MSDFLRPLAGIAGAALGWISGGPVGGAIGWGLGMGIGGALFPAEAERTTAQSMGPAQQLTPTSNYGAVVPVIYGTRRIAGNLIWWDNYNDTAHTVSFSYAVCIGPATTLRIYIGTDEYICINRQAICYTDDDTFPVDLPTKSIAEIVAAVSASGKVAAFTYNEYYGDQTTSDPVIVTSKGDCVPPYKNLHYLVFKDYPLGNTASIPQMTFEVASLLGSGVSPDPDVEDAVQTLGYDGDYEDFVFDRFSYNGVVYEIVCKYKTYTYDGESWSSYSVSSIRKLDSDFVVVATYPFVERYLSLPYSFLKSSYAPVSVDQANGRVLLNGIAAILIDLTTLNESSNTYKVFSNRYFDIVRTSISDDYHINEYIQGGSPKVYHLPDQYCDGVNTDSYVEYPWNHPEYAVPAANSFAGFLIPSTNSRTINYFLTGAWDGFKKQLLTNGAVADLVSITGFPKNYNRIFDYGMLAWVDDHPSVQRFVLGDDGYLYVAVYNVCERVDGWGEPVIRQVLGIYDLYIIKYSIGSTGTLTEIARRSFGELLGEPPFAYAGAVPIYAPFLHSISVGAGYVYLYVSQSYSGNKGNYLFRLKASDLSLVNRVDDPAGFGSEDLTLPFASSLYMQSYGSGTNYLFVLGPTDYIYIYSGSDLSLYDTLKVTDTPPLFNSLKYQMINTGYRGAGGLVINGYFSYISAENGVLRMITWEPDVTEQTDVTPQTISRGILTNEFYGVGLDPTEYLEVPLTLAAEIYAQTNDLLLSAVFDTQRSVLDSLQYVIQHHNGFITVNGGLVAHRQLEIEGAAIGWEEDSTISDTFSDGVTGTQWLAHGDWGSTNESIATPLETIRVQEMSSAEIVATLAIDRSESMAFAKYGVLRDHVSLQVRNVEPGYDYFEVTKFSLTSYQNSVGYSVDNGDSTYSLWGGSVYGGQTGTYLGKERRGVWQYKSTIDQGVTINEAHIEDIYIENLTGPSFTFYIYAYDVDTTADDLLSNKMAVPADGTFAYTGPLTTAYVSDTSPASWSTYRSPDIKAVIQEIVDRPGFVKGNNIVIVFDSDTSEYTNRFEILNNRSYISLVVSNSLLPTTYENTKIGEYAEMAID